MRRGSSNDNMIVLALAIGVPIYLLINFPVLFWFIVVPGVAIGLLRFIGWLRK